MALNFREIPKKYEKKRKKIITIKYPKSRVEHKNCKHLAKMWICCVLLFLLVKTQVQLQLELCATYIHFSYKQWMNFFSFLPDAKCF